MNNSDDGGTGSDKQFFLGKTKIQKNGVIWIEYDYNHTFVPHIVFKPISLPIKDTKSSSSMEVFSKLKSASFNSLH